MLFKNIDILMPDFSIIENGYVVTSNDTITYIGKSKPEYINKTSIYEGKNKLLIPGFINTHCHAPMTLLRGAGNDLPLSKWLFESIFPIEKKLTSSDIYYGAMIGIAEMIQCGVTSFSDMYYNCESTIKAVVESGISANISHSVSVFNNNDLKTVDTAKDIYDSFNGIDNNRILVDFCLHSEYTTTPESVDKIIDLAITNDTSIQLHLSETLKENEECYKRHKMTPVEYFNSHGLFDVNVTAAHCVYLSENDISILKGKSFSVAHCPISNLKLGSGFADIIKLKNNNLNITIGTDGASSNDNLNYIEDIKIAALLQKGIHQNPAIIETNDILKMATKNGAKSQKRNDTGEIKVGNMADLAIINYNCDNLISSMDKKSALIYSAQPKNIEMTMCRGKIVYEKGDFKTIDIEKILYNAKKINTRIKE